MKLLSITVATLCLASVSYGDMPSATQWKLFENVEENYGPNTFHATNMSGVPTWLKGTSWHNAFGLFGGYDDSQKKAWTWNYLFDCTSAVYKLEIDGENQAASLAVRMTPTQNYLDSVVNNKTIPPYRSFGGTTPGPTIGEKIHTLATLLGTNFVVNIWHFSKDYIATISDQAGEAVIDPVTLGYNGTIPFDDPLTSRMAVLTSAHPVQPANSKYMYRYHTVVFGDVTKNITHGNAYVMHRQDTTTNKTTLVREPILKLPTASPSYMHSFCVTAQEQPADPVYMVFFEYPLKFDISKIVFGLTILPAMLWKGDTMGTRIKVIKIDDATGKGEVVYTKEVQPMFAYHFVNSFYNKEKNVIEADLCAFPNADHLQTFELKTLRNHTFDIPSTHLSHFEIPVSSGDDHLYKEVKAEINMDLPRYDLRRTGLSYRYIYSVGADAGDWYSQLYKTDLQSNMSLVGVWKRDEFWPSEPLFVPRPGSDVEDDGVVLSIVLDGKRGTSFLLILNATTFEQQGFIDLGQRLPFPAHGMFDNGKLYTLFQQQGKKHHMPSDKEILGELKV